MEDIDVSRSSAHLLMYIGAKTLSSKQLINLVTDDDPFVRTIVAQQLHNKPTKFVFSQLRKTTNDKRDYVREIAAYTLGQLGAGRPFEVESGLVLTEMCDDSSDSVRAAAVAAIGQNVCSYPLTQEVSFKLSKMIEDSSNLVRESLAFSLGFSDHECAIKALNVLKKDKVKSVVEYAKNSLENMGS